MSAMKRYYLVTDATAGQVERATGLPSTDTPLGALAEARDPVVEAMQIGGAMAAIDRALNPRTFGCRECGGVVIHGPSCSLWNVMT
jgi:hypothetical protein